MIKIELHILSSSDVPVPARARRALPAAFIQKSPVAKLVLAKVLDE